MLGARQTVQLERIRQGGLARWDSAERIRRRQSIVLWFNGLDKDPIPMPIVALSCVAVVMFVFMNEARFVLMFVNVYVIDP